jgi:hypothetical protein|tara:strand:+ start:212 stop:388 length:177 start_codon:yes stop_codon:yes gene_type:complete
MSNRSTHEEPMPIYKIYCKLGELPQLTNELVASYQLLSESGLIEKNKPFVIDALTNDN